MTSIRNGSPEPNGKVGDYPLERFVTDFDRLIVDVDRLITDIGGITTKENGYGKVGRQRDGGGLNDSISALQEHARTFVKSAAHHGVPRERPRVPYVHQLALELSNAQTFMSVARLIRSYSRQAFASPAGVIFLERNGQIQLASQWRSHQVSKKFLSEERIQKGPIKQTLRTGSSLFWSETKSGPDISRYLRRLFPGPWHRNVAFLPIGKPGARPVGVFAMLFLRKGELPHETREKISRFAEIISGSIVRACAYDEAVAARAAADNANKLQEDFLSVISHELRNPMTPILNCAIALSSGRLPADKQTAAIEVIVRNVRGLNYLIDDLFDLARISSGKLQLEFKAMRIQEAARDALTATQQAAESKKLRITTDISEAIPPFFADPRRVRQALTNLLNNAVKFTPGGGSITLRVGMRRGHVECTVSDTGKGIAPAFLPFVFDRFRQEDGSSNAKGAGLGLGLAIVREIIELHGGTVRAHSQGTDHGSTFTFSLPLRRHKRSRH